MITFTCTASLNTVGKRTCMSFSSYIFASFGHYNNCVLVCPASDESYGGGLAGIKATITWLLLQVLELAGRYRLNFRLFSLIAALSEKVVALE